MTPSAMSLDNAEFRRRFRITIAMVGIGQLAAFLNATILTTALPRIIESLDMTPASASWVFTATLLFNTVASPIWGRLADRYSPLLLIRISLGLLMAGAVIGALAPTGEVLILGRAVQGLGYGGVFSLGIVVLANITPPRDRGRYFGLLSALALAGQLSGPLIGGLLVESPLGWHACLYAMIPLLAFTLFISMFALPLHKDDIVKSRIDWPGAILLGLGVSGVLVWVSFVGETFELVSWMSLGLLGGGLLAVALAIVIEVRSTSPILPVRAMRGRVPILAAIAALALGGATMPLAVFLGYYLQLGRGIPPILSGLILLAAAIGSVIAAFVVGARSERTGRLRRYLVPGSVVLIAGSIGLFLLQPDSAIWVVVVFLLVFGVGQGATVQFVVLAAQNTVGTRDVGSVTGFMSFVQLLGSSLGLSLVTSIAVARLNALEAAGATTAEAYASGVPGVFILITGLGVIAFIALALLPPISLRRTLDVEQSDDPDKS